MKIKLMVSVALLCVPLAGISGVKVSSHKQPGMLLNEKTASSDEALPWVTYKNSLIKTSTPKKSDQMSPFYQSVLAFIEATKAWEAETATNSALKSQFWDDLVQINQAEFLPEYIWEHYAKNSWQPSESLRMNAYRDWFKNNMANHVSQKIPHFH